MTTRPLPLEAEIFTRKGERFARWKDSKGKTRTEALTIGKDGRDRVVAVSPYFIAKYRDGSGLVVEQSTACRDETAARKVPADWGVERNRLSSNPFAAVPKAIVKADPRRTRRAMVETELVKLLDAAQRRPLRDDAAKDRPEIWERRKPAGRERALIYKTLVLTGLRKGELASLTVGQLDLDRPAAYAALDVTMHVYNDPRLLDIHGAVDVLPALPLSGGQGNIPNVAKATGTDTLPTFAVAPAVAPPTDFSSKSESIPGHRSAFADLAEI